MLEKIKQLSLLLAKLIVGSVALVLLSGYLYTFYKEQIHSFSTPDAIKRVAGLEGDLTYLAYGETENQPIILLHGTGANALIWEKTSVFLADKGYYVVAIDLPPFGWSSIPKNQDYRKETQAKRVIEILTALSITDPIILGHSFNSKVALQVIANYPSKELVLVAPVLEYGDKTKSGAVGVLSSISIIRDPLLSLFVNNTLLAKKILLSFMYKKDSDISTTLSKTILPFNKKGVNHAYGEWFQEFFDETSTVSDSETLAKITIPVKVLWGNRDSISPIDGFDKLQTLSRSASLTTLEGVGHMPHLEDPSLFNNSLLQALSKN